MLSEHFLNFFARINWKSINILGIYESILLDKSAHHRRNSGQFYSVDNCTRVNKTIGTFPRHRLYICRIVDYLQYECK